MSLKTWHEIPIGGVIVEAGNAKEFKTGAWRVKKPVTDKSKCTNCMRCVIFCPDAAINTRPMADLMETEKAVFKIKTTELALGSTDYDICKGCGICAEECPVKAIEMMKE
jgi:pyruvate ferredoxin oxidoreductase delta subunit